MASIRELAERYEELSGRVQDGPETTIDSQCLLTFD